MEPAVPADQMGGCPRSALIHGVGMDASENTTTAVMDPPDRDGATNIAMDSVDVEGVRRDCCLSGTMNTICDATTSIEMDSGTGAPEPDQDQAGPFDGASRNVACAALESGSTTAFSDGAVTPLPTTRISHTGSIQVALASWRGPFGLSHQFGFRGLDNVSEALGAFRSTSCNARRQLQVTFLFGNNGQRLLKRHLCTGQAQQVELNRRQDGGHAREPRKM